MAPLRFIQHGLSETASGRNNSFVPPSNLALAQAKQGLFGERCCPEGTGLKIVEQENARYLEVLCYLPGIEPPGQMAHLASLIEDRACHPKAGATNPRTPRPQKDLQQRKEVGKISTRKGSARKWPLPRITGEKPKKGFCATNVSS